MQTKAIVSSPVFYAAGGLAYLASLVLWGREGLLGGIWEACRRYCADAQANVLNFLSRPPKVVYCEHVESAFGWAWAVGGQRGGGGAKDKERTGVACT